MSVEAGILTQKARAQRKHSLNQSNNKAWIGPEIITPESRLIRPGESVHIPIVTKGLHTDVPVVHRKGLEVNGRSSIAQRGGDLSFKTGARLANALAAPKQPEVITVPFTNHSNAPFKLKEGPVGRLVNRHQSMLTGEALEELLGKKIHIEGNEGDTWWKQYGPHDELVGIGMFLKPELHIPLIPQRTTPLDLPDSASGDFRDMLDAEMELIGNRAPTQIRIGETIAEFGLDEGVLGFIDPRFDSSVTPPGIRSGNRRHINARYLYPGYVWPIRTEILTSASEIDKPIDELPRKAVVFTFSEVV